MENDLFTDLAEQSPMASFVFDLATGRFTYTNPAFRSLFRTDDDNLDSLLSIIPPKEFNYLKSVYSEYKKGKVKKDIEFKIVFDNDEERFIRLTPAPHDGRTPLTLMGFARDVTDETNNVESIRKYANKKNAVLLILAHDLSGPLGVSRNLLSLIERKVQDTDIKRMIEVITRANSQSINMINDLVQRELMETSGVVLYKKRVNAVKKLKEVIEEYKAIEFLSHRTFNLNYSSENIVLDLDEPKFIQVINNLMSNALKFTNENGTVNVSAVEKTESVVFCFADDGIGIPKEFHNVLFDKFTVAGRAGLQGEPSIGLGLSIIKSIIEWHKGRIWFESEEKKGTAFYFEIPYASS
jgi:two-component system sensor histidine kinase VicK